jgi:hypothetical protein
VRQLPLRLALLSTQCRATWLSRPALTRPARRFRRPTEPQRTRSIVAACLTSREARTAPWLNRLNNCQAWRLGRMTSSACAISRTRHLKDSDGLAETLATFVTHSSSPLGWACQGAWTRQTAGLQRTTARVGQSDWEGTFARTRGNGQMHRLPTFISPLGNVRSILCCPSRVGPVNVRGAQESGRRLKASVARSAARCGLGPPESASKSRLPTWARFSTSTRQTIWRPPGVFEATTLKAFSGSIRPPTSYISLTSDVFRRIDLEI